MLKQTSRLRAGDHVRITDRIPTPHDLKSGLYYSHFRGLAGTIQKVYGDLAAVEVDHDSLPADVLKRHTEVRNQMFARWMEGLSPDVRRKLTPEQKQFNLRYVVLVGLGDVKKARQTRAASTT